MSILGKIKVFRRTGWGAILECCGFMVLLALVLALISVYIPNSQWAKDGRKWLGTERRAPAACECVCPEPEETP